MWWVDLSQLSDTYPVTFVLPHLNRAKEESQMEKFMSCDKDREVTYHLLATI